MPIFSLQVSDDGVVVVSGDLDATNAPSLQDTFDDLSNRAHQRVVLDVAGLTFLDSSGLRVIAATRADFGRLGRSLAIRGASTPTRRLLAMAGLVPLLEIDDPDDDPLHPPARSSIDTLAGTSESIDLALEHVVQLAAVAVASAHGVSVSLERHGRMMTAASSDAAVMRMDQDQYATGEGPCLSAAAEGQTFSVGALSEEARWPSFAPLALEEGIASILSTPLMNGDRPIGALNIYSTSTHAFGPPEETLAQLFASHAARILVDGGFGSVGIHSDQDVQDALFRRKVIAQAQGVLMERLSVTQAEATSILHRSARYSEVTVAAYAIEMVRSVDTHDDPEPS